MLLRARAHAAPHRESVPLDSTHTELHGTTATVVVGPRQFKAVKKNRKVYHLIPHILE